MTFLVVDNNLERLWGLVDALRKFFPQDTVEYTHDPFMAGRFAANKHVDLLLCEYDTRPINGAQLYDVISKIQPNTKTVVISDNRKVVGSLKRPVTKEALKEVAAWGRKAPRSLEPYVV